MYINIVIDILNYAYLFGTVLVAKTFGKYEISESKYYDLK